MSKEKNIMWGHGIANKPSIRVTGICVSSLTGMVTVEVQSGRTVEVTSITMEKAQEIGFINLQALAKVVNPHGE